MSSFGLVDQDPGFNKKLLVDILASIEARQKATISGTLDVSGDSPVGQFNGSIGEEIKELWDVAQDIHTARDPNNSEGAALDSLMAITGAQRLEATKSTLTAAGFNPLTLTGTPATVVLSGSQASVTGPGEVFETTADATITLLAAWTPTTAYVIGDRRTNSGNAYEVEIAGTSAGAGGPGGTDPLTPEVDGTVTWRFMGVGTGAIDVDALAILTGPTVANAFTLTTIETPVAGWAGVTNLSDATTGTDVQLDPAARSRREDLLRQSGKATLEAVRAAVLTVLNVDETIIFENTTLVTDGEGVPGKSFETVVLGGLDASIRQALFDTKPTGIQAFGAVSGTVVDSQGISHTIEFSRPTTLPIFLAYTLVTNANYPADGDAQVKAAAKALGDALSIGADVIFELFKCAAFDITGVIDITSFFMDIAPAPAATANIITTNRQLATFDTGDITVSS